MEISKIFEGFNMVCAYIDDVIFITKNNFKDHLKESYRVLQRITEAGLKLNAEQYFFEQT